jgi:hypothetical protein
MQKILRLSITANKAASIAIESAPPDTAARKTAPAGQSFKAAAALFSN